MFRRRNRRKSLTTSDTGYNICLTFAVQSINKETATIKMGVGCPRRCSTSYGISIEIITGHGNDLIERGKTFIER